MRTRVKICGLTSAWDARFALEAGADALGFVFHAPSPRSINLEAWAELREALPPWTYCVAVFGPGDEARVPEVLAAGGFSSFQVHGQDPAPVEVPTGVTYVRAFDPERDQLEQAQAFLAGGPERAVLLDPRAPDKAGGTGKRVPLRNAKAWLDALPGACLAGGLTPETVAGVVRRLGPAGVDVSSGVEKEPGKKDASKVRAFLHRAKHPDAEETP